jgi:hypothetical protein
MDVRPYTKAVPFHAACIIEELSHHLNEQFILFTNDRNKVRTKTNLMSGVCFEGALHIGISDSSLPPANL